MGGLDLVSVYAVTVLIGMAASTFLTPVARRLGPKLGAMDEPDELAIHNVPTPRTGGLAIFMAFLLALYYGGQTTGGLAPSDRTKLMGILIGGGIICLIGLLGDMGVISSKVEVALQIVPAALVILAGVEVSFIPLRVVSIPLTLFYLIGGSCAFNLLDGMDGLAAGVAAIASVFFAILSLGQENYLGTVLSLALFGASLGFLWHNFHQAKVFMGDVGSLFLGFTLTSLAVLFSSRPYDPVWFAIPVLIIGLPVLDTSLAIVRRLLHGRGIVSGDRKHFYDLLRKQGMGDMRTVLIMYGLSALFGMTALALLRIPLLPALGLVVSELLLFGLLAAQLGAFEVE